MAKGGKMKLIIFQFYKSTIITCLLRQAGQHHRNFNSTKVRL